MPTIVVRPFEERDREAFFHVRAMTYNDGRPVAPEDQVFKTTRGFVGEVDGQVAGVYSVLDFTCTRGDAAMKDAAVAGVAVLPEYRRSGVGSAMMAWSIRNFREDGFPMASLYAFRESYYRRFGYEACGSRIKITVPNSRYPDLTASLPVRRMTSADLEALKPAYQAFASRHSGMNLRTDAHWGRLLGPDTAIYAAGDPVEAYLVINHQWQFWQGQTASELVWSSQRGYESILATLAGIGINKSSIEWYEPSDGPFLARFLDQGVKAEIERLVMYRVCDVPAALRSLKPSESGEFSLEVDDPLVPENRGPWRVRFSPSGVEVEKTAQADLQMSPQTLVQALLGQPSLEDLARNGLICPANRGALGQAAKLLPPLPVYCTDFF